MTIQILGTLRSGHVESNNYGHDFTLIYFVVSVNNISVYIVNYVSNCLAECLLPGKVWNSYPSLLSKVKGVNCVI